jgi:hypothetical protein
VTRRELLEVVAVDPAARRFAYAVGERGMLRAVGYAEQPSQIPLAPGVAYTWVMEMPRDYPSRGETHSDLDRLRATLEVLHDHAQALGHPVVYVRPSEWKGNIPKVVHHNRLWSQYSAAERTVLGASPSQEGYTHDTHDAAGIFLWATGRTARGRTWQ